MKVSAENPATTHTHNRQAHSPFGRPKSLGFAFGKTPGILENVPERPAKPNCFFRIFDKRLAPEGRHRTKRAGTYAKSNLVPPAGFTSVERKRSQNRPQCGTAFSGSFCVIMLKKVIFIKYDR